MGTPDPTILSDLAARIRRIELNDTPTTAGDAAALPVGGRKALAYLVRSTSQRPLTVAEARDKLTAREHPDEVIDVIIDRAVAQGVLDDGAFATAWVNDRGLNRGYGRGRLQQELRRRRLPDHVIDDALSLLDGHDEFGQAMALARARFARMDARLEPLTVASRLSAFLLRRGFTSETATRVARQVSELDRRWD